MNEKTVGIGVAFVALLISGCATGVKVSDSKYDQLVEGVTTVTQMKSILGESKERTRTTGGSSYTYVYKEENPLIAVSFGKSPLAALQVCIFSFGLNDVLKYKNCSSQ